MLTGSTSAFASHIVGGEVTYKFIGVFSGKNQYEISLTIYEDCLTGSPDAIANDDPAIIAVFDAGNFSMVDADSVHFSSSLNVPINFSNSCVTNIPDVCLIKKVFIKTFYLPVNTAGYYISYQKCCRNASVINIQNSGSSGATYFGIIPAPSIVSHNTSAIFTNFPPQVICINNPLNYDHSATDADGDSLSYEFCDATTGPDASSNNILPDPPPYGGVQYSYPFSGALPITGFPNIQINPVTGVITGTPNRIGRFLVTVCCNEWRHGIKINTIKREFQFVITDCSKTVVACMPQFSTDINTYIVQCKDFNVHFENCSTGGFAYHWDFGVPGITSDTSDDQTPTFTYPDTGIYIVKLLVNPTTTCPDSISKYVKVFPTFSTAFNDTGLQCPGMPISFFDLSAASIKPVNGWTWNFGDGSSSTDQNPQHTYQSGGTYNVMLSSQNIKHCIDTSVQQVLIESFKPFAGDDTIIVKGESIQFNPSGGETYGWSPGTYLNATDIKNPIGFFPDTGVFNYVLYVTSSYGCKGYDTIRVWVVNQASFYIPTAFSPNGDGLNDVFRPVAVGYRSVDFFKVYNRWGEQVYFGENITAGWDGTYNHKQADMGTYFWQISFIDRDGKRAYLKGDVTLVK